MEFRWSLIICVDTMTSRIASMGLHSLTTMNVCSLLGWLRHPFWRMAWATVVRTTLPTEKLCCALVHSDFVLFFLSASTAKHYADCKPHISLSCYSLSLPATAKHYATCQFQVSVIRYSYHLTEKWMLCVLLTINNWYETINGFCCFLCQLQQSITLPVRLYRNSLLYLRVSYYIRTTWLFEVTKNIALGCVSGLVICMFVRI